jgi:hypothetical protein
MNSPDRGSGRVTLGIICGILVGLTAGCKDDNSVNSGSGLTESDAAMIIASSFGTSTSTCGLTGQIEETASLATGGSLGKAGSFANALGETTITRQKSNVVYTYDYTFNFVYGLVGTSFDVTYHMTGTYTTQRMSSDDSANAVLHFTNLLNNAITLNGTYRRMGTQTFRIGETKQFTTTIEGIISDVTIDRSTKRVTGGTVVVGVTTQRNDGSAITLNGTLTFLGNRLATLVINGKTFNLNLEYAEAASA